MCIRDRVCGLLAYLLIGVAMAFLAFFHGDFLSGLFARDPQVIAASADYLRAYAVDTLLVSFLFCFSGYFNGCGKTTFVMAQGIAGAFLVRIPVSFLMKMCIRDRSFSASKMRTTSIPFSMDFLQKAATTSSA